MENTPAPDTSNFLDWVEIKNFKSIKDLRLDCKRVNIFIGKPNVGKSNILEALGMLGISSVDSQKYMDGSVRYNTMDQLFFDNDTSESVSITTNLITGRLAINEPVTWTSNNLYSFDWTIKKPILNADGQLNRNIQFEENGLIKSSSAGSFTVRAERDHFTSMIESPVKKYDFEKDLHHFKSIFTRYLIPPHGHNLYEVINRNPTFVKELFKLFQLQGLELILINADRSFNLQKRKEYNTIQYPYFSIADTFRRFMFYIAAIESNENSVIVFEEPEVHSFPPYTNELAHRMIFDDTNQYFISTHSPYLLHAFIENLNNNDLTVFVTYYENYETKVRALTPDELRKILDFGTDVFFNLDKFTPNAERTVPI